jgi:hypothetical protein
MTSNLKIILSAVGVAALLASPVMAKTARHQATQSLSNVPADAQASVSTYATPVVTPYSADVKVQAHSTGNLNADFQLGAEK